MKILESFIEAVKLFAAVVMLLVVSISFLFWGLNVFAFLGLHPWVLAACLFGTLWLYKYLTG